MIPRNKYIYIYTYLCSVSSDFSGNWKQISGDGMATSTQSKQDVFAEIPPNQFSTVQSWLNPEVNMAYKTTY